MDRDLLNHLPVILAVARRKNFAAAASELGMGPSAVSHAVRLVEERLGVPLFARTTRNVALTEAGAALVASAAPALQDIADRVERIRAVKGRVSGLLRLNVPRLALSMVMTSVVREMAKRFPDVTVEIFADDAKISTVTSGKRLAISRTTDVITIDSARRGTFRRRRPLTRPLTARMRSTRSEISCRAGAALATKAAPASVSATLRVVRANSGTPNRSSTRRTAWLTAEGPMPSSEAAAAKFLRRATARTTGKWLRRSRSIHE